MMNISFRKILLWIFIGLLSLGQLQRIELSGNLSGINFYLHDVFIVFWLVSFIFTELKSKSKFRENISFTKFKKRASNLKIEIIFLVILIAGIILNLFQYGNATSLLYAGRLLSYVLFFLSLRYFITTKQISAKDLRFKFFGVGVIILFLGFLQFTLIKDTRFLNILGWDDHYHRLISTILDPGFTGIILVISYFYFLSVKNLIKNKIFHTIIELSFFWGIALTFSRATYLSLIISLLGLGIIKKSKFQLRETAAAIIVFIAMILVAPKPGGEGTNLARTSTIVARQNSVAIQLSALKPKTLLIGNGLFSIKNNILTNNFSDLKILEYNSKLIPSHSRIPDNLFINILLSTGVIGTGLFIFILLKWSIKITKIDQSLGMAILATIIHSQFSNSLLQPFVLLLLLGGIASLETKS